MPHNPRHRGILDEDFWDQAFDTVQDYAGEALDYVKHYPGRYLEQVGSGFGWNQTPQGLRWTPSYLRHHSQTPLNPSIWSPFGPPIDDLARMAAPDVAELINTGLGEGYEMGEEQAANLIRMAAATTIPVARSIPKYWAKAADIFKKNPKGTPQQLMQMAKNTAKYPGLRKDLEYSGAWEKLIALPPTQTINYETELSYTPVELTHRIADQPREPYTRHALGAIPKKLMYDYEKDQLEDWIKESNKRAGFDLNLRSLTPEKHKELWDWFDRFAGAYYSVYDTESAKASFARQVPVSGVTYEMMQDYPTSGTPESERYVARGKDIPSDMSVWDKITKPSWEYRKYSGRPTAVMYDKLKTKYLDRASGYVPEAKELVILDINEAFDEISKARDVDLKRLRGMQQTLRSGKKSGLRESDLPKVEEKGILDRIWSARGMDLDKIISMTRALGELDTILEGGTHHYEEVRHPTSWVRPNSTNYRELKIQYDPPSGEVFESDELHYGRNILGWSRMNDITLGIDELPDDYRESLPTGMLVQVKAANMDEVQSKWMQKARGIRQDEIKRRMLSEYAESAGYHRDDIPDSAREIDEVLSTIDQDQLEALYEHYSKEVPQDFGFGKSESSFELVHEYTVAIGNEFFGDSSVSEEFYRQLNDQNPDTTLAQFASNLGGTVEEFNLDSIPAFVDSFSPEDGHQPPEMSASDTTLGELGVIFLDMAEERARGFVTERVPDAPFKDDWHELVVKDSLWDAAIKGAKHFSWSTPELMRRRWGDKDLFEVLYGNKIPKALRKVFGRKLKIYKSEGDYPVFFIRLTNEMIQKILDKGFSLTQVEKEFKQSYA